MRSRLFAAGGHRLLADGWFPHVFVDRGGGRPTPIPAGIREALGG